MRITRFYHPEPIDVNQTVILTAETFQHAIKVLRLKEKAPLILFNSVSGEFEGVIEEIAKRTATVKLTRLLRKKDIYTKQLHLGQGIISAQKMDLIIQKATELGVGEITPLYTEYSQVKWVKDYLEKRMLHWQNVAISAAEQCGRIQPPLIHPPMEFYSWIKQREANSMIMLHPQTEQSLKTLADSWQEESVSLLIGPEGGFSDDEVKQAEDMSINLAKMGQFILRAETAAVAALAVWV